MTSLSPLRGVCAALLLAAPGPALASSNLGTPDIYADFKLKQQGNSTPIYFTILLDRPCAPRTVANFLGLASGLRPWVKPGTGTVSNAPFYTGTQVYKIIPQSGPTPNARLYFGSPTNANTSGTGPGYVVQDEARNSGNYAYAVYMENNNTSTGTSTPVPNNNGSRFFVAPFTQTLTANYTRLGVVLSGSFPPGQNGQNNLYALTTVPLDAAGKPTQSITIEALTFRGWSPIDPSFNVLIPELNLPLVSNSGFKVKRSGSTWRLRWADQPGSTASWVSSTNLQSWGTFFSTGFDPPGAPVLGTDITSQVLTAPRTFYRGTAVRYPQWPSATFSRADSILRFSYIDSYTNPNQNILLIFDYNIPGTGGTWQRYVNTFFQASGTFTSTYAVTKPFVGEMVVTPTSGTALKPFTFRLHFDHHLPVESYPRIDRFQAFTTALTPPFENHSGTWTYTFYPN